MANTPDYSWPPMETRKVIGKPHKRLDGPQKASGRAKYSSDLRSPACCSRLPDQPARACPLTSDRYQRRRERPRASSRPRDRSPRPATEIQWQGKKSPQWPPTTEEVAREAIRKIKVDYEVLPTLSTSRPGEGRIARQGRRRESHRRSRKALQEAEAVSARAHTAFR